MDGKHDAREQEHHHHAPAKLHTRHEIFMTEFDRTTKVLAQHSSKFYKIPQHVYNT